MYWDDRLYRSWLFMTFLMDFSYYWNICLQYELLNSGIGSFQAQIHGSSLNAHFNIRSFNFGFPCGQCLENHPNGLKLFGIGGKHSHDYEIGFLDFSRNWIELMIDSILGRLMASLKQLISKLHKLNELNLNDLTLERIEANSLMDQICKTLSSTLQKLSIENLTVNHCCLQQIAMLSNLEVCILHLRHILLSLFNPFFFKKKNIRRH